jgi:hypothetical protein
MRTWNWQPWRTLAWLARTGPALILALTAAVRAEDDPRLRAQAAVENGLKWLAAQQVAEGPDAGSWEAPEPRYRTTTASLAGLAFLANGHLPGQGEHGRVVERAMAYVKPSMASDGYLGQGHSAGMYTHAICTLFGLSYLGLSADPTVEVELAAWCRKSLRVIAEAQKVPRPDYARGGWRYTPHSLDSDLSVTSWQMLVLHAARQCGYPVEDESIEAAMRFINSAFVEGPEGAGFVYHPGVSQKPEPGVTGTAVFIKSLFERQADERTDKALAFLASYPPSWGGSQYNGYFFFSAFYMTQGMFQVGEPEWSRYLAPMRALLIEHQAGDGSWPYPPDDVHQGRLAGPAYPTAMAVLILSLEKQYLPMYQRQSALY